MADMYSEMLQTRALSVTLRSSGSGVESGRWAAGLTSQLNAGMTYEIEHESYRTTDGAQQLLTLLC